MKKYLMTGFVVLLPIALTFMVILFLFNFFTTPFVDLVKTLLIFVEEEFSLSLPEGLALFISRILSLIFLCIAIFLLGVIARWFLIRNFINLANRILSYIPFVKTVYKVSRDVIAALFSTDGKKAFKRPVMIPFPERPSFCLGFEAGEVAKECQKKVQKRLVSVFAPTAPHPISGFLFLVPEEDVYSLDMKNEEAVKFLVSCGIIYSSESHDS